MSRSSSRNRWLMVAVCSAYVLLCAAADAERGANNDASELDGTWKLASVEREGEEMQRDDDVRWVITGGKVLYAGEPLAAIAIYAASTPKGIDLSFSEPKNDYEGIFVLEKDELRMCFNIRTTAPKDRPFGFVTRAKTNLRVLKFERIDPSAAGSGTARGYAGMALAVENETVVIQDVLENSPAAKAGLRSGDVILSLGGQAPRELQATVESVRRQIPGSDLAIRVLREGNEKEFAIRVAVFPFSLLGILG